jgi:hypothetical protein
MNEPVGLQRCQSETSFRVRRTPSGHPCPSNSLRVPGDYRCGGSVPMFAEFRMQ